MYSQIRHKSQKARGSLGHEGSGSCIATDVAQVQSLAQELTHISAASEAKKKKKNNSCPTGWSQPLWSRGNEYNSIYEDTGSIPGPAQCPVLP